MRLLALLLCWPLLVGAQSTPVDSVESKRAVALAEQLRCLVCQNQSIAESNAELAVDLRRQISEQIAQGRSDRDITAFMVERYGDFVLYRPPVKATTLLLWFGPPLLLVVGVTVLIRTLRIRSGKVDNAPLSAEEQKTADLILGDGDGKRR